MIFFNNSNVEIFNLRVGVISSFCLPIIRLVSHYDAMQFRTNPKNVPNLVRCESVENQSDSIWIIPTSDSFRLILIENSIIINLSSNSFGLKSRIESDWFSTHSHRMRFTIFFGIVIKSLGFEAPWVRKNGFYESVCLSNTPFEGQKRKDVFVNQPFLPIFFGFIVIKNVFFLNQKFHFPGKIYEIR